MKIPAFLTAIVALSIVSNAAFAESNQFTSQTLGFALTKPENWYFISANTYLDQMKQVKWDDPADQEQWNRALRAPLVVISKFPPDHNGINPNFKVDAKPYGVIPPNLSGKEVLAKLIPVMQLRFKSFNIDIAPSDAKLGGQQAGIAKITYTSTSTTGFDFKITTKIWAVPMKSYVFIIGATYEPNSEIAEAEAEKIADSITIK